MFNGQKTEKGGKQEQVEILQSRDYMDAVISQVLLDTGQWTVDDSGIRRTSSRGRVDIACPHQIVPIERLVDVETGEEFVKLAYKRRGREWQTIIAGRKDVASSRAIVALASSGIAVTSNNASALVDYLNDIQEIHYASIKESLCVDHLGYIAGIGFVPYVDNIVYSGDPSFDKLYRSISSSGQSETWRRIAMECREMSTEAKIILASSFASPLISIVGALPFYTHLWGVDSGTGKSVALMLAASVWADPEIGTYIQTHNGTQVGQERTAAYLNHLPLCIDELQLANTGRGSAGIDVYQLAQGVGRSRGKKGGGIDKLETWRLCIISTGETPIVSGSAGAGAVNRVIEIETQPGRYVIADGHRIADGLRHHYGYAGKDFVSRLFSAQTLKEDIICQYINNLNLMMDQNVTDKQAMASAVLLTADQLVTEWIFKDQNALTIAEIVPYLATKETVSTGKRAYDWLCGWITANISHFCGKGQLAKGRTYGAIDGNVIYIMRHIYNEALQNAGYSPKATLSYLRANELIIVRDNKGYTRSKRISGIPTDCVCMIYANENDEGLR